MSLTQTLVPTGSHRSTTRNLSKKAAKRRAKKILRTIRKDHRFCANCYRQIREVEPPRRSGGRDPADWMIGYATPTPETIPGVDEKSSPETVELTLDVDDGQTIDVAFDIAPVYTTRRICECGACHHKTVNRILKKHQAIRYLRRLSTVIDDLRDEYRKSGSEKKAQRVEKWNHSETVLVSAYKHLKSIPDYQDVTDYPLFIASLATALRRPNVTNVIQS